MMDIHAARAEILTQALPYIQKYAGKIVVIKYGGNAMINEELKNAVMLDIVMLSQVGIKVVLVHGGGPEITGLMEKMGKKPTFINGLRYTDDETAEIVQMVLAGKISKDLVWMLGSHGGKALGLCGIDGGMIKAKKLNGKVDYGWVGDITAVDPAPMLMALNSGFIPVVATVGCDDEGNVYNINADTAAARIAVALGAENLILMTDIRGLLRDVKDENTFIPHVRVGEVPALAREGIINGGMIPKVDCCVESVRRGIKKAVIIDGRTPHAILMELLMDEGVGTMFTE